MAKRPLYGQMAAPQIDPLVLSAVQAVGTAQGYAVSTIPTAQRFAMFSGSWAKPVPYVLRIGGAMGFYTQQAGNAYPPGPYLAGNVGVTSFRCGGVSGFSSPSLESLGCAAVLEYGAAAGVNRVYFDWKPGAYQLPPCDYVSLSVAPYGAYFAAGYTFAASACPGEFPGAHVPQVSATFGSGAFPLPVIAPAGAQAVDFASAGGLGKVVATPSQGGAPNAFSQLPIISRDYTTGIFLPPWGPVETQEDAIYTLTDSSTAEAVLVTWYLRL